MIRSSLLTPFRWYDDFADQDRFSRECSALCPFELLTDINHLLPFMVKRPASGYTVDNWILRKACTKPYGEGLIPINNSNFVSNGYWTKLNWSIVDGHAAPVSNVIAGSLSRFGVLTPGKKYRLVFDVINYCGKELAITPIFGGVNLGNIHAIGHYEFSFTAINANISFNTVTTATSQLLWLDNVQVYEAFEVGVDDIELDVDLLKLVNSGSNDYIIYFGEALQCLPCGQWYSIIQTGEALYFSEVITIQDFIPAKSPYVLLTWGNSCDIDDVIYTAENDYGDRYVNKLWVDGPITKPEYPFTDDGEEDGNGVVSIDFQKWEKNQTIIIPKAPEFIVDAATAIRLHNQVTFTAPLRKNQLQVSEPVETERSESDLEYVFNDCAANVSLKMVLLNRVIDTSCCTATDFSCITCSIFVFSINELDAELGQALLIGYPDYDDGIYFYNDIEWAFAPNQNQQVCIEDETRMYTLIDGDWVLVPIVDSVVQDGSEFTVAGNGFPGTYVKVQVVWIDGTGSDPSVLYTLPTVYTVAQLQAGITFDQSDLPFVPPVCGQQRIHILNYTINCDYGRSNQVIFNYYNDILCPEPCFYDADACAFFATLTEELSTEAKEWYNDIFIALKSADQWDELERLWIFGTNDAGITITEESACTSLKHPTALKAVNTNGLAWDSTNGYTGDGVSTYLDLKYNIAVDNMVATQNNNGYFYNMFQGPPMIGASVKHGITGVSGSFEHSADVYDAGNALEMAVNTNIGDSTAYTGAGKYAHLRIGDPSNFKTFKNGVFVVDSGVPSVAFASSNTVAFAIQTPVGVSFYGNLGLRHLGYGTGALDPVALNSILP